MIHGERNSIQQDRDFWERMRKGDEQALAALFRRHYAMLYDYGLKLAYEDELVKDGIQEVFAYIWEKRQNLATVDSVRAYLLVSLRRQVLKSLERQQQRQAAYQQFDREQPQMSFSPEDFWVMAETAEAEKRALQKALREIRACARRFI
jgi:RNA polymerase sigma-70 factor (ECF subfamily)